MRIVNLTLSSQMANLLVVDEFSTNFMEISLAIIRTDSIQYLSLVLSCQLKEMRSCSSEHFRDEILR